MKLTNLEKYGIIYLAGWFVIFGVLNVNYLLENFVCAPHEPKLFLPALHLAVQGDIDPYHPYEYPPLLPYIFGFLYFLLIKISHIFGSIPEKEIFSFFSISPLTVITGRIFALITGTAGVILFYKNENRFIPKKYRLIGSFFLATNLFYFANSITVYYDIFHMVFTMMALHYAMKILTDEGRCSLMFGIWCGLVLSVRYNFTIIIPGVVAYLFRKEKRLNDIIFISILPWVIFLILCPDITLKLKDFFAFVPGFLKFQKKPFFILNRNSLGGHTFGVGIIYIIFCLTSL